MLNLLAYALPALPLAALTLPFYVLVPPFYAADLHLSLAAIGATLLAVRLIDAFSDPLVGILADRWRPAFGRRRLWVALACIPTALGTLMVMRPPLDGGLGWLFAWSVVVSIGSTALLVPYSACGAELSSTYAGRARVSAVRETFGLLGTLVALGAVAALPLAGFAGERATLGVLGIMCAICLPLSVIGLLAGAPEPADFTTRRLKLLEGWRYIAANKPFVRLLIAFVVNGTANAFPATLFLFFVGDRLQARDAAGPLLLLYFLCGIAGVPLWLKLAARTSKHRAWAIAMVIACAFFAAAPLLGPGDIVGFAALCVGTGLTLGADLALPPAIQADVIDLDTATSGEQRAAVYFALWGFATKLALAFSAGFAFPVLAAFGFDPGQNIRTTQGLSVLVLLYAVLPIALKLCAVALVWNFPVDAQAQAALRDKIEATPAPLS